MVSNGLQPELHNVRIDGKNRPKSVVVQCPCPGGHGYRLGNGRAVRCEGCGTLYARVGEVIVSVGRIFDKTNAPEEVGLE